jgi:hypothetical protein
MKRRTAASISSGVAAGLCSRHHAPGASSATLTGRYADLLIMAPDATPSLKRTRFHSICLRAFGRREWIGCTTNFG